MSVALINLIYLDPQNNGGKSRIAKEMSRLLCEIADQDRHFHPIFAVNSSFSSEFHEWLGRKPKVIPISPHQVNHPILRGLNCDLIISPLFGMAPINYIPELRGKRHIAVMPDTQSLDLPHLFSDEEFEQRKTHYELLKSATKVITLSEYSKTQLIHHLNLPPDKVVAIPLGSNAVSESKVQNHELDKLKPYLLYPANTWLHKRHELALAIFAEIRQKFPKTHLVLTGGRFSNFGVDIAAIMDKYSLTSDHVHDLGFVEDVYLAQLYMQAEVLLFTSEYEGFGMPIVEAMQLGCPVVCAPLTAIPETAQNAALYVDSVDPKVWADAILQDLPVQRDVLIQRGKENASTFTWALTREQYRAALVQTAPDVFNGENTSVPMVTLVNALREHNMLESHNNTMSQRETYIPKSGFVTSTTDLQHLLSELDNLVMVDNKHWIYQIPLFGKMLMFVVSLQRLERFWNAMYAVLTYLAMRQKALAYDVHHISEFSTVTTPERSSDVDTKY